MSVPGSGGDGSPSATPSPAVSASIVPEEPTNLGAASAQVSEPLTALSANATTPTLPDKPRPTAGEAAPSEGEGAARGGAAVDPEKEASGLKEESGSVQSVVTDGVDINGSQRSNRSCSRPTEAAVDWADGEVGGDSSGGDGRGPTVVMLAEDVRRHTLFTAGTLRLPFLFETGFSDSIPYWTNQDRAAESTRHAINSWGNVELPRETYDIGGQFFWTSPNLEIVTVEPSLNAEYSPCTLHLLLRLLEVKLPRASLDFIRSLMKEQFTPLVSDRAFEGCLKLREVTLPVQIRFIGDRVFHECRALTHVTLPPWLKTIGNSTFQGCVSLTHIQLPSSLKDICCRAFLNCTALRNISFPERLRHISTQAFEGCTAIVDVRLPRNISVDRQAFGKCSNLRLLEVHNTEFMARGKVWTLLSEKAFAMCDRLETVRFLGSISHIEHALKVTGFGTVSEQPRKEEVLVPKTSVEADPDHWAQLQSAHPSIKFQAV